MNRSPTYNYVALTALLLLVHAASPNTGKYGNPEKGR